MQALHASTCAAKGWKSPGSRGVRHHGSACVLGLGRDGRFWVTGGYLKEPALFSGISVLFLAKASVSVRGCFPGSSQDGARACLWVISSPLSFLGRWDPGGSPPACVPAAGQTQPRRSCLRYFSTLSHMDPLPATRYLLPPSPQAHVLVSSDGVPGLGSQTCPALGEQGVNGVPAAVAQGASCGSFFLGSCFHRLPWEIIFISGKQP